jgi:arsenate reductase (glutaredoxin)
MAEYIVYHNPRCSKSRMALNYLEEKGAEFDVVEYLKEIPQKSELIDVLKKLNIPAEKLLRKNEAIFKENFKGKQLSEEEWIDAMLKFPKLIERPIVIKGNKAVIARPTEGIDTL